MRWIYYLKIIHENVGTWGRRFVSHFSWKFSSFVLVLGGRLCTKILVFRVPQTSIYVLKPIRLTNLNPILRIHEWNIWFSSHMISWYFEPKHAFLVSIALGSIFSCLLSISWLPNCQNGRWIWNVGNFILLKMIFGWVIFDKVWESYAWSKLSWLFL